jgi:hypothetical protein
MKRQFAILVFVIALASLSLARGPGRPPALTPKIGVAEDRYREVVNKARAEYLKVVQDEMMAATEAAEVDLAKKIQNRLDAIEGIEVDNELPRGFPRPTGWATFVFDDGERREYNFTFKGYVWEGKNAQPVYWHKYGDELMGFVSWDAGGEFGVETFQVKRSGDIRARRYHPDKARSVADAKVKLVK